MTVNQSSTNQGDPAPLISKSSTVFDESLNKSIDTSYYSAIKASFGFDTLGVNTKYEIEEKCVWSPEPTCQLLFGKTVSASIKTKSSTDCYSIGDGPTKLKFDFAIRMLGADGHFAKGGFGDRMAQHGVLNASAQLSVDQFAVSAKADASTGKWDVAVDFKPFCPPTLSGKIEANAGLKAGGTIFTPSVDAYRNGPGQHLD